MMFNVSYNWLKEFVPGLKASPEEVARRLSLHAFSVDRVTRFGDGLEKIVIGRVVKIEPHPDADKLRIAYTEASPPGGRRTGLATLKIVCGGTNVREGMTVAVALPGAKVRWHGEGELVELKPAEIRGVRSEGMICAASEIDLFDYFPHKEREIMDLTAVTDAKPGTPIAKALGLDDVIFEIEVTTNRPDGMSVVGIAREMGAVFGVKFANSQIYLPTADLPKGDKITNYGTIIGTFANLQIGKLIDVQVKIPKLCPHYQAAHLRNVTVAPSPWWMQKRLIGAGIRPINNVVDITNYVMLEVGQPMHAFDAARLEADTRVRLPAPERSEGGQGNQRGKTQIVVRNARKGETLKALDGQTYVLDPSMVVIADAERPIAIAGVMGGEETGVTGKTKEIIFESATFDPLSVRRTARALNLHSDSSVRFEKGISTESTQIALARAVQLAQELCAPQSAPHPSPLPRGRGSSHAGEGMVEVVAVTDRRAKPYRPPTFTLNPDEVNALIGVEIPAKRQVAILQSLGFVVSPSPRGRGSGVRGKSASVRVQVPYFRDHDIESDRDLAEEIARIHGYHALPATLPQGEIPVQEKNKTILWEDRIREALVGDGYAEIFTYSMLSADLLRKTNYQPEKCLRIANPLSVDLEYMRPSLIPATLHAIAENEPRFPTDRVFEISHVYLPRPGDLPVESTWAIAAVWSPETDGAQFFAAKGMLEAILQKYNVAYLFKKYASSHDIWHPARTLLVQAGGSRRSSAGATEEHLGTVGEIHPAILARFGIKGRVAIFEFALRPFIDAALPVTTFEPIPEFPSVKRDIAFVVPERTLYARVVDAMRGFNPLIVDAELFDVYHGKEVSDGKKSMAFHLTYRAPDRTLKAEEAEAVHEGLGKMLEKEFGAVIRA